MAAYYNEKDAACAAWLRNLVSAGHIAAGDVDDRDIRDVCAAGDVARLRAYGNAINPWVAAEVIKAWMAEAADAP